MLNLVSALNHAVLNFNLVLITSTKLVRFRTRRGDAMPRHAYPGTGGARYYYRGRRYHTLTCSMGGTVHDVPRRAYIIL
eukprot:SAG31_NODE_25417_length_461_cov_3.533149_1_plen_79_part_00